MRHFCERKVFGEKVNRDLIKVVKLKFLSILKFEKFEPGGTFVELTIKIITRLVLLLLFCQCFLFVFLL